MRPRVWHRREGIQLSYDLPYKTYTSLVYPRRSANGSVVIINAHEKGLGVIWYGGRGLRDEKSTERTNDESIDRTEQAPMEDIYGSEHDESDPSRPFHSVLAQTEIPLDSAAVHIAVPPLAASWPSLEHPVFLQSNIVIAVGCADRTIRLVMIALDPTNHQDINSQQIQLQTSASHQDLFSDIAITLTADGLEETSETRTRSRSKTGKPEANERSQPSHQWFLLIASASATGGGLLLIHQIPLESDGQISTDPEDHVPTYHRALKSSTVGCQLSFNPSPFPSERHSHLLIAVPGEPVRVHQTLPIVDTLTKQRSGSLNNADSVRFAKLAGAYSGKPLINLMPPFNAKDVGQGLAQRKRVLDAQWILQGRAVIVLLDDGEWGIWDIEAAGPVTDTQSKNLVRGQNSLSGIHGGSLTKFALRGTLTSPIPGTKKTSSAILPSGSSALAPMTPHTRKVKSAGIFGSERREQSCTPSQSQLLSGKISICPYTTSSKGLSATCEESATITYGATTFAILSIQAFWRSEVGGRSVFDTTANSRPLTLPNLQDLANERGRIQLLPFADPAPAGTTTIPAFLTSTCFRLSFLVQPLADDAQQIASKPTLPLRFTGPTLKNRDQALLNSGELDIAGMDRVIEGMSQGPPVPEVSATTGFGRKSVNFHLDDDEEMDDSTPTVVRNAKFRLTPREKGTEPRRLFT